MIMKRIYTLLAACALISLPTSRTEAQTNLQFWVQSLNVGLSGSIEGVPVTNGIVARVKANPVKISSREVIAALNGKPASVITVAIETNVFVITNVVHHTNVF